MYKGGTCSRKKKLRKQLFSYCFLFCGPLKKVLIVFNFETFRRNSFMQQTWTIKSVRLSAFYKMLEMSTRNYSPHSSLPILCRKVLSNLFCLALGTHNREPCSYSTYNVVHNSVGVSLKFIEWITMNKYFRKLKPYPILVLFKTQNLSKIFFEDWGKVILSFSGKM